MNHSCRISNFRHNTRASILLSSNALFAVFLPLIISLIISFAAVSPAYADELEIQSSDTFWTPLEEPGFSFSNKAELGKSIDELEALWSPDDSDQIGVASSGKQLAKSRIVAVVNEHAPTVSFSYADRVTVGECKQALVELMSHPGYCYVNGYSAVSWYTVNGQAPEEQDDRVIASLSIRYATTDMNQVAEMKGAIRTALTWTTESMTDAEKAQAMHDYLVRTVAYDYENLNSNTLPVYARSPYGALVAKSCVCAGYAYAYQVLMSYLNIECAYISGTANDDAHGWNVVKVDNTYYNVDATFDDPLIKRNGVVSDAGFDCEVDHTYFMIDDQTLSTDHEWTSDYVCPTIYTLSDGTRDFIEYRTALSAEKILISDAVVSEIPVMSYTGKKVVPDVVITYNGVTLIKDVDYRLEVDGEGELGTTILTIYGIGNYTGSIDRNFTIARYLISNAEVDIEDAVYTGSAIDPDFTVTFNGDDLEEDVDYTVEITNNINAGLGTITLMGRGEFGGTKKVNFTIAKASVSDLDVQVSDVVYAPTPKKPNVVVKFGSKVVPSSEYTVVFSNNTKAGTAMASFSGFINFEGSVQKEYRVQPKSISANNIKLTGCTYSGSAQLPTASVVIDGKTLIKNTDYKITATNNINAGIATATISGLGNYTGSVEKTYTISPKNITGAVATIPTQSYSGSLLTPVVSLRLNGKTLVQGTDFTVAYNNNTLPGSGRATINAKGNYSGSIAQLFTISCKDITRATVNIASPTYNTKELKPVPTVVCDGKTLVRGKDYTVAYANNVSPGTAKIAITGINNYSGVVSKNFAINKANINSANATSVKAQLYTGKSIKPAFTLTFNGLKLKSGTDYTYAYKNNTKVGTATIEIKGAGRFQGTKNITFKIAKGSWVKSGKKYRYKHPDGSYTKKNWEKINGKYYYFDASGYKCTGWKTVGSSKYYLGTNGVRVQGKWQKISGKNYYFDANGKMAKNKWIGKKHVNASGVLDKTKK